MLPSNIESLSSQPQTPKKFKTLVKNAFTSLHPNISLHPHQCLFIFLILSIHFFVFFLTRTPSASLPKSGLSDDCNSGRIYVYQLPPMFNRELLSNCDDLDPWHWQCGIATNNGFGRRAREFERILPASLAPAWYRTNQFSLEIMYHHRIMNHKCRTLEPELATAFYIPFYAGLAVGKYLFDNHKVQERDFLCEILLMWLQDQPYWKRSNGSDHFIVLGRITWDFRRLTEPKKLWGSSFLNMPSMQHITRLTIERAPSDYYDIGVPYPTGFHPHSRSQILEWQSFIRGLNRSRLTSFVGATRVDIKNDFRGYLLNQCRNENESCSLVDCAVTQCSNGSTAILEALLDSNFCLQPRGDSYTRRSIFDCMIAGSIPVFFWKRSVHNQYEWFLPAEPDKFSVFIDHNDVMRGTSVKRVLEGFSKAKIAEMKERVIELIPKIVYAIPGEGVSNNKDAFDIAVEGVLERFRKQ
ncbi:hypothetical protein DCAR_0729608 [Daucus carota subsp. sativus]|uniref:Exostosin GT47 domain-containing protein n=1 Tax=Daucus carota subsp. sativus TaxID=79200 RepID=A0A164UBY3_DAUCS|nr:PREDICTED: xyloglucan galactosyltransferase XLT2-like [Daucus carota subsp. sativus]WOH10146.1 hypothetical protein DCAR_0729608 [Daucus carota subsp. sativus]